MFLFGAVQHRLGVVLSAVPRRPLLHLIPGAAAEPQQLIPMVLHKEQDAGNHRLLLLLRFTKGVPVDMNMEAAGTGFMAGVAHADGLGYHCTPGHFREVVAQCHGVGDDLHAVL